MNINKLFFIIVLIFVFYTFGLLISNIINNIFPACDFKKKTKFIFVECFIQIAIIYLFFFISNKYITNIIEKIFKNVTNNKIDSIILTITSLSFSSGVFKHLDELNNKMKYLKEIFFN